jgi:hypothetical protein
VNWARRILGEMTGCASIGTVEVGTPMMVGTTPISGKRRPAYKKVANQPKTKRKPVSESMTADVAPTLVGVAPELMARRREEINRGPKKPIKKKSAVESILGEAESLIPDGAEDLLSTKELEAKKKTDVEVEVLGSEDLLEPALALVAPDTTPNATRELDPSLVPNRDPALDTLLGQKPVKGPEPTPKKGPEPLTITKPVESKSTPSEELPSGDMPRPPGDFLKPIGGFGESKEAPKVELVVGSGQSIVGSAMTEGELGAASMPVPQEGDINKTMDVFRRFHRV